MCYFFKFLKEMEANFDHLKIQFEEVPSTPIKNSLIKPIGLAWRVSDLSKDSFRTFKCHSWILKSLILGYEIKSFLS